MTSALRSFFGGTKSVEDFQEESSQKNELRRRLGALDVVLIGTGDIIGAGIFVITGTAAAKYAGPAIIISFLIAAVACAFAGLCYAEMAAMIPVSGSAYSYAYASGGEVLAWIIGWDLMLEYLVGSALCAQGWSAYLKKFFKYCGVTLGPNLTNTPWKWDAENGFSAGDGYIDLPALLVVAIVSIVLVVGVRQSANFNHFFVVFKLVVILLFIVATWSHIDGKNFDPFFPPPSEKHEYGVHGIFLATTQVFFAFIGFDAVANTAQETHNPARDMPIGILGSLVLCTFLYIMVCVNLVGIAPYYTLETAAPLAQAVENIGMKWLSVATTIGALAGLTSVITVALMSQPRVFYSMSRDGLLPQAFAKVHPKFKTPYITTITTGIVCALMSGFVPLDVLNSMSSVGTLFAFAVVCISVAILRYTRPDVERKFKVPGGPLLVPVLGAAISLGLIIQSGGASILRVVVWMAIGLVVYVAYGRTHSVLRHKHDAAAHAEPGTTKGDIKVDGDIKA
ncbi:Cationic amino acid transporter-1 [Allomyces javanicus]|nr:Cationic amino acid transporter-1 [Allomyces javanicus]